MFYVDNDTAIWMLDLVERYVWLKEAKEAEEKYQDSLPKFQWEIIPPMSVEMQTLLYMWNAGYGKVLEKLSG